MRRLTFVMSIALCWSAPTLANPIERACLQAGRPDATRELCTCVGVAAMLTLSDQDQRTASAFFNDPQAAQDMRLSDRRRDEAFWSRYEAFGRTAEDMCG